MGGADKVQKAGDGATEKNSSNQTSTKVADEAVTDETQAARHEKHFTSFSSNNDRLVLAPDDPLRAFLPKGHGTDESHSRVSEFTIEDAGAGKVITARGGQNMYKPRISWTVGLRNVRDNSTDQQQNDANLLEYCVKYIERKAREMLGSAQEAFNSVSVADDARPTLQLSKDAGANDSPNQPDLGSIADQVGTEVTNSAMRALASDALKEAGYSPYRNNSSSPSTDSKGWNPAKDMARIDDQVKDIYGELVTSGHHQIDGLFQDFEIIATQQGGLQRAPLWGCCEQAEFTRSKLSEYLKNNPELAKQWKEPEVKSLFVHNWVEMDSKDGKYKVKVDPFFFETEFLQTD